MTSEQRSQAEQTCRQDDYDLVVFGHEDWQEIRRRMWLATMPTTSRSLFCMGYPNVLYYRHAIVRDADTPDSDNFAVVDAIMANGGMDAFSGTWVDPREVAAR